MDGNAEKNTGTEFCFVNMTDEEVIVEIKDSCNSVWVW